YTPPPLNPYSSYSTSHYLYYNNNRHISRKGPLIVYRTGGAKTVKAFCNIPGIEITNVERLNLLKLAPDGHWGRFVIWTKTAFEKLDSVYGLIKPSEKKGYVLLMGKMTNSDLIRIINSDEVCKFVVRPVKKDVKQATLKKNPLKNLNVMLRLNLYAKTAKRMALDRRNYKQLVETAIEIANKVCVADIVGRIVEDLKDESESY
ncbi:hypothetical protein RYX36_006410, partial [Vicia faba]